MLRSASQVHLAVKKMEESGKPVFLRAVEGFGVMGESVGVSETIRISQHEKHNVEGERAEWYVGYPVVYDLLGRGIFEVDAKGSPVLYHEYLAPMEDYAEAHAWARNPLVYVAPKVEEPVEPPKDDNPPEETPGDDSQTPVETEEEENGEPA